MNRRGFLAVLTALLVLFCHVASAEEDYINLTERFDDVLTYEYDGATYYLKERISTTLVLCANPAAEEQQGAGSAELIVILPVDDNANTSTPMQLETGMTASWLEGEDGEKTLGELYSEAENADAGCMKLMEAVNALFPEVVIERYAALDLRGLPKLDGIENDEINVTGEALVERLKAIKRTVEQDPEADLNGMLNALSGYIVTDMKSGELVKVVDKVDRYDRAARAMFPTLEPAEEKPEELLPDLTAFEEWMVGVYFDDARPW